MQCIVTSFNCCYSNRLGHRPLPIFDLSISFCIFANFMILMLQVFWTASLHLEYSFTLSKSIPHKPIIAISATKFKGLYCFFDFHGNNVVYLF